MFNWTLISYKDIGYQHFYIAIILNRGEIMQASLTHKMTINTINEEVWSLWN